VAAVGHWRMLSLSERWRGPPVGEHPSAVLFDIETEQFSVSVVEFGGKVAKAALLRKSSEAVLSLNCSVTIDLFDWFILPQYMIVQFWHGSIFYI
jgi:hypothetical protein